MTEGDCVDFLRWALPRLGRRWAGYRKVRRQVCKRVQRRRRELGLGGLTEYRDYLEAHGDEWRILDSLTSVTISRFYRDRGFFDALGNDVLPALVRGIAGQELRVWSAGCASGEEPYTIALIWAYRLSPEFPRMQLRILATDVDHHMLRRAEEACYRPSSLKELPDEWRRQAFVADGDVACLSRSHVQPVTLARHDLRADPPDGPFDLILCRNSAFTYFDEPLQRDICARLAGALRRSGALAVGAHEEVPGESALEPWPGVRGVYRVSARR